MTFQTTKWTFQTQRKHKRRVIHHLKSLYDALITSKNPLNANDIYVKYDIMVFEE